MIKILIVDDEQDAEALFRQRFRHEIRAGQLWIHFAINAKEAMEFMANRHPMDIMLVFSDINMPGISGLDLLGTIREQFPDLKVIMITAYDDHGNKEKAMELGARGFITKPVDFELLRKKIEELTNL